MTDKTEAQPEALRLADERPYSIDDDLYAWSQSAEQVIRAQHAEIQQLKAQLTSQTNRAAAAEQQVTALTQRMDMANRLNTDARNQLAQLSARQAAPDGWRLVPVEPTEEMIKAGNAKTWVLPCNFCWSAMLSAAPPPPEREPLTDEQILQLFIEMYGQEPVDITEFAEVCGRVEKHHGIGATND